MRFLIFLGTVRQGRRSEAVAKLVHQVASKLTDHQFELIDPRDLDINFDTEGNDRPHPQLQPKVVVADGYIIVAPEYNHGYPSSLKYMLDLHLKEYIHKPVAFVGVSSGVYGGARMIEALVSVVRELGMVATFTDVNFSNAKTELSEDGEVKDQQTWERRINRMLDELLWMAGTLKWGRENVASQYHQ